MPSITELYQPLRLLIVEDDAQDVEQVVSHLRNSGCAVEYRQVARDQEYITALQTGQFHLILADWMLPGFSGREALKIYKSLNLDIPFLICSGRISEEEAIEAMRSGASDFIYKDSLMRLVPAIERELMEADAHRRRRQAESELANIYGELERRVDDRTRDLQTLNEKLMVEIGERKRIQAELQRSENSLRLAIAGSNGCIWRIHFDRQNPWNVPESVAIPPAQKQMIGFADDQFPNSMSAWHARVHPHDLPRVRQHVRELIEGQREFSDIEYRILHRDGSYRWLHIRGAISRDVAGTPIEWTRVVWDVTDRKSAEQAIAEQNETLQLAIEGSQGVIWATDADPTQPQGWADEMIMDERMKRIIGFADGEFPSSREAWESRVPGEYRNQIRCAIASHTVGDSDRYIVEYPIRHRLGHFVWVMVRGAIQRDDLGRPRRLIGIVWDITERKQAEETLREQSERIKMAVEETGGILVALDLDPNHPTHLGESVSFDPALKALLGYSGDEIADSRDGFVAMIHREDQYRLFDDIRTAAHGDAENRFTIELRLAPKDGREVWAMIRGAIIRDENHRAVRVIAMLWDITAKRQAEQARREYVEQLRVATEGAGGHLWRRPVTSAPQSSWPDVRYIDEATWRLLGYRNSRTEIRQSEWEKMMHPEDIEKVRDAIDQMVRQDGSLYDVEYRIRHHDGYWLWVASRGAVVRNSKGDPTHIVGILYDITARKSLESHAQAMQQQLAIAVTGTDAIIWSSEVDADNPNQLRDELRIEPRLRRLLGYETDELPDSETSFESLIHPDDLAVRQKALSEALRGERDTIDIEYRVKHRNGQYVWLNSRGYLARDEAGHPQRIVGVVWDISERRRAEQRIREQKEQLELAVTGTGGMFWYGSTDVDARLGGPDEVDLDDRLRQILGYTAQEFPPRRSVWEKLIHPDDMPTLATAYFDCMKGHTPTYVTEYRMRKKDGDWIWIQSRGTFLRDQKGAPTHVIGLLWDITDRKKAEEQLREKHEQLNIALRGFGGGAWSMESPDAESAALPSEMYISPEMKSLIGYGEEELPSTIEAWLSHIHPDDRDRVEQDLAGQIQGTSTGLMTEYRMIERTGTVIWVVWHATVIQLGQGGRRRLVGLIWDITERKNTEAAILEAKNRAEAALSELASHKYALDQHAIVATTDRAGDIIYANEKFCEISKYSREELIGKNHRIINSGFHPKSFFTDLWRTISSGNVWHGEIKNRAKDGSLYWVDTTIVPFKDARGEISQYVAIRTDITKRKIAEEALRESEERFRIMADSTPVIIWVTDDDGKVSFINKAYRDFLAGSVDIHEKRQWEIIVHPDDAEGYISAFNESLKNQSSFHAQARIRRYDGEWRWIESYGSPRFSPTGDFLGMAGSSPDITDRKMAEEELRRMAQFPQENPAPVFRATADGRVLFTNQPAREYLAQVSRSSDVELPDYLLAQVRQVLATGRKSVFEAPAVMGRVYAFALAPSSTDGHVNIYSHDITERKRAEERLAASQERYRRLVDSAPHGVIVHIGGRIVYANPSIVSLLGYENAYDIIGKTWLELVSPDHRRRSKRLERIARGEVDSLPLTEYKLLRVDGTLFEAEIAAAAIELDGQMAIQEIIHDVSEVAKVMRHLRESEERFRAMADSAPVLIWLADTTKLCTWFNEPWLDFVGRPLDRELGYGWTENVHPDDTERCIKTFEEAFDDRREFKIDFRLRHASGEYRWVANNGVPRIEDDGTFVGYIGSCVDITDRRNAAEALRRSEEEYRLLVNHSPDGIVLTHDDMIVFANPAFLRTVGATSPQQVLGRTLADFIHPDQKSAVARQLVDGGAEVGGHSIEEYRFIRLDGNVANVEMTVSEIMFSGRAAQQIITRDVSELRRLTTELKDSERRMNLTLSSAPITLWQQDKDLRYMWAYNAPAGYIPEDMTGKTDLEIAGRHDEQARLVALKQRVLDTGKGAREELQSTQPGTGRIQHFDVNCEPIFDDHGKVVGISGVAIDITALRTAETAAVAAEKRLMIALSTAPISVWQQDTDLRYLWVYNSGESGVSQDEYVGKTDRDVFANEMDVERFTKLKRQALDTGTVVREIVPLHSSDGRQTYWDCRFEPWRDDQGQLLGLTGTAYDVTEQVLARRMAREQEMLARAAFDNMPHSIGVFDADFRLQFANRYSTTLAGKPLEAMLGRTPEEYSRHHEGDRYMPLMREAMKTKATVSAELQFIVGAEERYFMASIVPVLDDRKEVSRLIGIGIDITDRKRYERALAENEQLLRASLDNANASIAIHDPDLRLRFANQILLGLWNTALDDIIGKPIDQIERPDWLKQYAPLMKQAVKSKTRQNAELTFVDGRSERTVDMTFTPITDNRGRVVRLVTVGFDITYRKEYERRLRDNEALLREAFDNLPANITVYDEQGCVRMMNKQALKVLKCELGDVIGKKSEDFNPPERLDKFIRYRDDAMRTGEIRRFEIAFETDGRSLTYEAAYIPVKSDAGEVRYLIGLGYDITQRREIEETLRQAHDQLEQRVLERTMELVQANEKLVGEIEERERAEQALRVATEQLELEREALVRKNIALREVFDQIESEKNELKLQLATNVEQAIMPTIIRLKEVLRPPYNKLIETLERDFSSITSPFLSTLKAGVHNLSPRELEVCRLIRNGLSTKEIAEQLSLSPMTVQKHREVIRKKLGLTNADVNLQTYLQSLTEKL